MRRYAQTKGGHRAGRRRAGKRREALARGGSSTDADRESAADGLGQIDVQLPGRGAVPSIARRRRRDIIASTVSTGRPMPPATAWGDSPATSRPRRSSRSVCVQRWWALMRTYGRLRARGHRASCIPPPGHLWRDGRTRLHSFGRLCREQRPARDRSPRGLPPCTRPLAARSIRPW
jgi:hypothetical protein